MLESLAASTGTKIDELQILLVILLQIPISLIYRCLPNSHANRDFVRHLFGAVVGLVSNFYLFETLGVILLIANVLLMYPLSRRCTNSKLTLHISAGMFVFLCGVNIWKLFADYEGNTNNISLLTMLIVPKQIYFNWFVLNQVQKEKQVAPSIFDYFCYVFNYVGSLITPIYSYEEYEHFIKQTHRDAKINKKAIIKKAGSAAFSLLIIIIAPKYFDESLIVKPEFAQLNILSQLVYIFIGGSLTRVKYYVAFHLSEIPTILGSLKTKESNYTTYMKAIGTRTTEFKNSVKLRIEKWNITISQWLKECFYIPLIEIYKLDKNTASTIVFILSAFWHGFYVSYYVSFFAINLASITEKLMYQNKDLFWWFPSLFFRLQLDVAALMFKKYLFRELTGSFRHLWVYFTLNIGVFYVAKWMIKRKKRRELKAK
jgi:lysophospholipid acyltransferase